MTVMAYQSESILDPRQEKRAKVLLRMAQFCAVAPMATGVVIVVLYWLVDWEWLVAAGILMLPIGVMMVLVGLGLAVAWGINKWAIARRKKERFYWGGVAGLIVLLLANFGVAYGCAAVGSDLINRPQLVVRIVNETGAELDQSEISTWRMGETFGPIPNEKSQEITTRIVSVRTVHIRVVQGGKSKDIDHPVTYAMRSDSKALLIHVRPGLEMKCEVTAHSSIFE